MHGPAAPPRFSPAGAVRQARTHQLLCLLLWIAIAWQLAAGALRCARRAPAGAEAPRPVSLDVGTDPAWRLVLLPGIGPARAEAIVRSRAYGPPLRTLEDLERIPGIGPVTIARLRSTRIVRVRLHGTPVGWPHDINGPRVQPR